MINVAEVTSSSATAEIARDADVGAHSLSLLIYVAHEYMSGALRT